LYKNTATVTDKAAINSYKKVSYRKQITCQHSCPKIWKGLGAQCKKIPLTVQNSIDLSYSVRAYIGNPPKLLALGTRSLRTGSVADS